VVSRHSAAAVECDVFCRVVDNFGDAAVAWRLARILALEHGYAVRLLIDKPQVLARLLQRDPNQPLPWRVEEVMIEAFDTPRASAAPLLIEAFGCGLPEGFMARRPADAAAAVLINVEYLSAEEWPDGVHGLSSPARAGLPTRHFFFPGCARSMLQRAVPSCVVIQIFSKPYGSDLASRLICRTRGACRCFATTRALESSGLSGWSAMAAGRSI
jgi:hypothetical protein